MSASEQGEERGGTACPASWPPLRSAARHVPSAVVQPSRGGGRADAQWAGELGLAGVCMPESCEQQAGRRSGAGGRGAVRPRQRGPGPFRGPLHLLLSLLYFSKAVFSKLKLSKASGIIVKEHGVRIQMPDKLVPRPWSHPTFSVRLVPSSSTALLKHALIHSFTPSFIHSLSFTHSFYLTSTFAGPILCLSSALYKY